jgi:(4S)-4-hydroxy-5-phosphonooxypentane-2,3-dione isomerase
MYVLFVRSQLKPEYREQFMKIAKEDARGSNHDEPGCLRFDVLVDEKDANLIYFYEVYKDQAAFQAHQQTPHFFHYRDNIKPEWYVVPTQAVRSWSLYPADVDWK